MRSALRPALAITALAAAAVLLSGCSLLGLGELERGADGQVLESTVIDSPELLPGDCFSYVGDGSDLSTVTVTPCSTDHTYIVLAAGDLTTAQVDAAGGLQNAVSGACNDTFTTFKAGLTEGGLKTKQEFLVSTKTVDEVEVQDYSCVALDPKADPAETPTDATTGEAGSSD